jgi:hypothetical protein
LGERPWYADFFDDDYLRIFASELLDERTAAEVNGVAELLGLPPGCACSTCAAGTAAAPSPWPGSATGSPAST